jgi:hypothetical protein
MACENKRDQISNSFNFFSTWVWDENETLFDFTTFEVPYTSLPTLVFSILEILDISVQDFVDTIKI